MESITLGTYIPIGLMVVVIGLVAWLMKLYSVANITKENLDNHAIHNEKKFIEIQKEIEDQIGALRRSLEKVEDEYCTMDGRLIKIETKMDTVITSLDAVTDNLQILIGNLRKKK